MSVDPRAIRRPGHGKTHRAYGFFHTRCGLLSGAGFELVPLSQIDPADRCRRCWPKEEV